MHKMLDMALVEGKRSNWGHTCLVVGSSKAQGNNGAGNASIELGLRGQFSAGALVEVLAVLIEGQHEIRQA